MPHPIYESALAYLCAKVGLDFDALTEMAAGIRSVPAELVPILEKLGVPPEAWTQTQEASVNLAERQAAGRKGGLIHTPPNSVAQRKFRELDWTAADLAEKLNAHLPKDQHVGRQTLLSWLKGWREAKSARKGTYTLHVQAPPHIRELAQKLTKGKVAPEDWPTYSTKAKRGRPPKKIAA